MKKPGRLASMGIGMALMYYFDPRSGRSRRAQVRRAAEQAKDLANDAADGVGDLGRQFVGLWSELRAIFSGSEANERNLPARVQARLGRYVSDPKAIDVSVQGGRVVLHGSVASDEMDALLRAVSTLPGVTSVENSLAVRPVAPATESSVQWTPATRLVAATVGTGLLIRLLNRPNLSTLTWGGLGLALCVNATAGRTAARTAATKVEPTGKSPADAELERLVSE